MLRPSVALYFSFYFLPSLLLSSNIIKSVDYLSQVALSNECRPLFSQVGCRRLVRRFLYGELWFVRGAAAARPVPDRQPRSDEGDESFLLQPTHDAQLRTGLQSIPVHCSASSQRRYICSDLDDFREPPACTFAYEHRRSFHSSDNRSEQNKQFTRGQRLRDDHCSVGDTYIAKALHFSGY